MVVLEIFLFIGALRMAVGDRVHAMTLSSACRLNVKIRVGDSVRWANPTHETIRLVGEGCCSKLNLTVQPKHTATHMFQNRGIFKYRTSRPCDWKLGIIRVKRKIFPQGRFGRSNPTQQSTKGVNCLSSCNAAKITDLSSGNLCSHNFDYVIHGKVGKRFSKNQKKIVKKYVMLDVVDDFRQKIVLKNTTSSNSTSIPFLLMSQSNACFCRAVRFGADLVMMGYTSGLELVIDSRTRTKKWEPKLKRQLSAYRHKVNTSSCN